MTEGRCNNTFKLLKTVHAIDFKLVNLEYLGTLATLWESDDVKTVETTAHFLCASCLRNPHLRLVIWVMFSVVAVLCM